MSNPLLQINKVRFQESEYDKAVAHSQKERASMEQNWAMYSGFNHGQWQALAVAELQKANRHIAQYNIVRGKVENLAGSIIKNNFDVDYIPVDGEDSNVTRFLKGLFYSDKEMMDWDSEHLQTVIDGLVHTGIEEMYISDKYNVLGNIAFRRCMPGHIILDPHWKSHKSEDLKNVWKVAYLTPEEIKKIYAHKSAQIDNLILQQALSGMDYKDDTSSESMLHYNLEKAYGSQYRLVERHYIVETPKKVTSWIGENGKIDIPDVPQEQKNEMIEYLKSQGEGEIFEHRTMEKEYRISTSCSQLDTEHFLEDRKAEIQIGRLPFFPWSAARINGVNSGIVDLLIDAQQSLNKRESLSDHMIANSSHGARFLDPSIVDGDDSKLNQIVNEIDKPNATFITASGALQSGRKFVQQVEKTQYSGEIYKEIERMVDYLNKISKVDSTLEGESSGSEDNGIFFARRQVQAEIALTTLIKSLEQHWNDKGEAYMLLAQTQYTGAVREFRSSFGLEGNEKETITLNADIEAGAELRNMPRHKVVVTQSPTGITVRTTDRAINSELLARIPVEQQLYRATISKNIMNTLVVSDKDRKFLEIANDLELRLATMRATTELKKLEFEQFQIDAAMQQPPQTQDPNATQPPEGGGGEQSQPQQQVPQAV